MAKRLGALNPPLLRVQQPQPSMFRPVNYSNTSHLMPPGLDTNSGSPSQSSDHSPVSPGTASPIPFLHPSAADMSGAGFDMRDHNALSHVSAAFPELDDQSLNQLSDPALACQPEQSHSFYDPLDPLDKVRNDLLQLGISIHEGIGALDHSQLLALRGLLSSDLRKLDALVQAKIDSDVALSPSSTSSNGERYECLLCPNRPMLKNKGTFRRHVSDIHVPRNLFRCPDRTCAWVGRRRDKIHDHCRTAHRYPIRLRKDLVNSLEIKSNRPTRWTCDICRETLRSWESYFECLANHCRRGNGSTSTSAYSSRNNSYDQGDGRGGGNGGDMGPGGFSGPGSYSWNGFWGGEGGFQNGNSGSYPPQQFYGYGNGNVCGKDADLTQDQGPKLPDFLGHEAETSNANGPVSRSVREHREEVNETDVDSREEASHNHHPSLQSQSENVHQAKSTQKQSIHGPVDNESGAFKTRDRSLQTPRCHCCSQPCRCAGSKQSRHFDPEPTDKQQCRSCGHIFDGCLKCQKISAPVEGCHACADKTCVQEAYNTLHNFDHHVLRPSIKDTRKHNIWDCSDAFNAGNANFSTRGLFCLASPRHTRAQHRKLALKALPAQSATFSNKPNLALQELQGALAAFEKVIAVRHPNFYGSKVMDLIFEDSIDEKPSWSDSPKVDCALSLALFTSKAFHGPTIIFEQRSYAALSCFGSWDYDTEMLDTLEYPLFLKSTIRSPQKPCLLLEAAPSTKCQITFKRHSALKEKVLVVVKLLQLRAAVAKPHQKLPKSKSNCMVSSDVEPVQPISLRLCSELSTLGPKSIFHQLSKILPFAELIETCPLKGLTGSVLDAEDEVYLVKSKSVVSQLLKTVFGRSSGVPCATLIE